MTPPTEPAPVHNPERPNSLATRRNQSPGRLKGPTVTAQPSDARPPPAAIDHTEQLDTLTSDSEVESESGGAMHMTSNVEELFNNLPSAYMLEEQDVLDLTSHRKVDSPLKTLEFEALLQAKAPELLEQWKQERQLMYDVQDMLQKELENSRQLRELNFMPLPDSKKLSESMGLRKIAETTGLKSPSSSSKSFSSSQRYVRHEVDRIDRSVGSPTSPGPSPLRTSSSLVESGAYLPRLFDEQNSKTGSPKTPKSPMELRHDADLKALEVQVKLRLLPAIVLLSSPSLDSKALHVAYESARSAWYRARTRGKDRESAALMGMCEYYIGLCKLAQADLQGLRDGGRGAEQWFAKASVNAEGVYREAILAEKVLATIRRAQRPDSALSAAMSSRPGTADSDSSRPGTADGNSRPGTSGTIQSLPDDEAKHTTWWGWRTRIRNLPRDLAAIGIHEVEEEGSEAASPPFSTLNANATNAIEMDHSRPDSGGLIKSPSKQIQASDIRRLQRGTRIPTFSSEGSEVSKVIQRVETPDSGYGKGGLGGLRLANASAGSVSSSSHSPVKRTATTTIPAVDSSTKQTSPGLIRLPSSPAQSPGGTPKETPTEIPSPVTSPTTSHAKRKSVAFSLAALGSLSTSSHSARSSPQASPRSIESATILARRMGRRISSITTGALVGDSYRDAEEGRSPYRATFSDVSEEGARERSRKKSAEDMV
ncbi:hypothetical protein LTR78_002069 [Recurvomyces mirabilis]|uniref:Uncharacterized protein n=1 Tax=Recurvomyces mirabilis TaxID=574656 RepID=A0AAE1C4J8_9PEZI|nr:hypothetical protein LTR78_002069 [Recurvomyces mirabilis]KAK5160527.1 hypothetical protein LTS14_001539 [Recurvomyces mirabilis]